MSTPRAGETIAHYRVLDKIGEGGMGEVFKAEDTRLQRFVALKFLPARLAGDGHAKRRFRSEALAASALDHPNICAIYDIGETDDGMLFLAFAYCEGQTVKERILARNLTVEESVDIAIQVASGLEQAHKRGIVHRDIKPANVIVSPEGIAKILDFGVAKIESGADITATAMTVGSPAYMSPDQIRAAPPEPSSDLWSLGAMLYEMLTGERAFKGENSAAVMMAVIESHPRPAHEIRPAIDPRLSRLLDKALAKDTSRRYRSAADMRSELRTLDVTPLDATRTIGSSTLAALRRDPSIGVLPFADLSQHHDQEYFCEGLAEELIMALTQIAGLRVASRDTTRQFRKTDAEITDVGRKLGVDNLLTGSVRKAGDQLRVTTQLVKVEDGSVLDSSRFDRKLDDVFAIQEEIARSVVDTLRVRLVEGAEDRTLVQRPTDNVAAYNLYLEGRWQLNKRTEEGFNAATPAFEAAVEADPGFALPYVGLADLCILKAIYGWSPENEVMPVARRHAEKALEIDPQLAAAHTALANVRALYDWDIDGADRDYQHAIRLAERSAEAYHAWAINLLAPRGRFDEALVAAKRALRLDPKSLAVNVSLAWIYYYRGNFDRAVEQFDLTLGIDRSFPLAHQGLAEVEIQRGNVDAAVEQIDAARSLAGNAIEFQAIDGYVLARAGREAEARAVLERLQQKPDQAYFAAVVHLGLGEFNDALDCLEKAESQRSSRLVALHRRPIYDPLRTKPRFERLVERIGF